MRQFFETYLSEAKLAPLVRELSWTHNLLIMSRCKRSEEREFYLRLCIRERWGKRELQRELAGPLFERTVLSPPKLAPAVRELHPDAATLFKDNYLVEFQPPGSCRAPLPNSPLPRNRERPARSHDQALSQEAHIDIRHDRTQRRP
jgi:predicted nuclease of restriction endonuclease-like (RecB) superfamily